MKNTNLLLIILIFLLGFSSCVKDEPLITEDPVVGVSTLKINEIVSTGDPDWMELYNGGNTDLNLAGYKLADSNKEWTIGDITIPAGGYVSFDCDGKDENGSTNFKISSGGEQMTLYDKEGKLIDQVTTPDMSDQTGLAYGRESDGADNWIVMTPTRDAKNSNVNEPPVLVADELTEFTTIYKVKASDADGMDAVKLVLITDNSVQSLDMVLIDGKYQISVPTFPKGTKVSYYVKAIDLTGKTSFYPSGAPADLNTYYVTNGKAIFLNVDYQGEMAGNMGDVTFTVDVYDNDTVKEVKLYYVLPGQTIDDKTSIKLDFDGSHWTGVVPAQPQGSLVKYYLRAKNNTSKSYYPEEGTTFDHDVLDTWPTYQAGDVVVINGFSLFSTTDPVAGSDLKAQVHIKYDNGDVQEVKFYYVINYDPATYDGSQRVTIKWEGDLPTANDFYDFTIPASEFVSGDKIIWYMRAKDGAGDKKYFTLGKGEDFDKDVIADWNEIVIQ